MGILRVLLLMMAGLAARCWEGDPPQPPPVEPDGIPVPLPAPL